MENKKFAEGFCLIKVFWIFIISSIFGCIMEMINHYIHFGNWVSRSAVIYGPFNPVYGMGAVLFMIFLKDEKLKIKIFMFSMILGGVFEYLCSLIQEKIFGTISWDYSKQPFNINGRTGLFYMICWGVLGLLFIKVIYPKLSVCIENIPINIGKYITISLLIFMLFNIFLSASACLRECERVRGISASNKYEIFLDKHYPSERLNKIYENNVRKDIEK